MSDTFEFDDKSRVERLVGTLHDPGATVGDVLTVQADKSIAAQPGGGGSGGVQVVTVPVSSAEILALHDTPVTLVPGVPGSVICVIAAAISYQAGLTPYTTGGGALDVVTEQASSPGSYVVWCQMFDSAFLDTATNQVDNGSANNNFGSASTEASDWDGQDLIFRESVGNPTDGDGTLLVTVSYFLAPTV